MNGLQWGHRLSAMETSPQVSRTWRPLATFNGATAFRRWKLAAIAALALVFVLLQWGHRLSAMETMKTLWRAAKCRCSFNGATAFRRWKLEYRPPLRVPDAEPSMGPPPFGDGN